MVVCFSFLPSHYPEQTFGKKRVADDAEIERDEKSGFGSEANLLKNDVFDAKC